MPARLVVYAVAHVAGMPEVSAVRVYPRCRSQPPALGSGGQCVVVCRLGGHRERREFAPTASRSPPGALLSTRIFLMTLVASTGERVRLPGSWTIARSRAVREPGHARRRSRRATNTTCSAWVSKPRQRATTCTAKSRRSRRRCTSAGPADAVEPWCGDPHFRGLHAALGLVNVNFRDTRRADSYVELAARLPRGCGSTTSPTRRSRRAFGPRLARSGHALAAELLVPPGMAHVRPMGASVHYAGTVPMTRDARRSRRPPGARAATSKPVPGRRRHVSVSAGQEHHLHADGERRARRRFRVRVGRVFMRRLLFAVISWMPVVIGQRSGHPSGGSGGPGDGAESSLRFVPRPSAVQSGRHWWRRARAWR